MVSSLLFLALVVGPLRCRGVSNGSLGGSKKQRWEEQQQPQEQQQEQ